MKILVTGSNGLLGQKIIHALMNDPDINLFATSKGENRISDQSGYVYYPMDITDPNEVTRVFDMVKPDVVINTAAMTNVDACEKDQELCWKINVDAVGNMLEACKPHKAHFIHLSTDFVFDGKNGPYKEEDAVGPLSHYARSKVASEALVMKSSLPWAIARTIIIYGVAEGMSRSNIVLWVKQALSSGETLRIVNDQYRMPTLAEDLADACIRIAKRKATGIFHVSGDEMMNMVELAQQVADFFGGDKSLITEIETSSLNQAAERPPVTGFVLDKAKKELGYKPHSFQEGLRILSEQLKKMPVG
ncbi:MAG: NAD(P)-dependent oxidoreductase [Flavobacteriales bacterium]|nr:NAD(P)-dependent oxidoreductase [Flavobacteriales bacterium]